MVRGEELRPLGIASLLWRIWSIFAVCDLWAPAAAEARRLKLKFD